MSKGFESYACLIKEEVALGRPDDLRQRVPNLVFGTGIT
jgi:hypothetical protein